LSTVVLKSCIPREVLERKFTINVLAAAGSRARGYMVFLLYIFLFKQCALYSACSVFTTRADTDLGSLKNNDDENQK